MSWMNRRSGCIRATTAGCSIRSSSLRDLGNTVLVVEHDAETIERADYVIDLGPGAGRLGGELVAHGTPREIEQNPDSLTGQYLSGARNDPDTRGTRARAGETAYRDSRRDGAQPQKDRRGDFRWDC